MRVSRPYVCETYNLITATSPAVATLYGSAFGASDHEVVVTGYPRNDSILGERLALTGRDREAYEHFASMKDQGKKIVLYLPTWRDHQRSSRPVTDWRRLGEFLARWNAVFVRKLHSYSVGSKGSEEAGGEILSIDPGADIYPLLRLADVLVTDYSSVAFDFMLLERPIVYYCYDLEEYLAAARSLYFDYHKVTPGDKARTFDELMSALQRALEGPEYMRKWENLYATTVALCHTYRDSHAARRVYEEVLRRYGE